MRGLLFLLFPFSVLYDGITRLRNAFYDGGLFKSTDSKIPAVVVGNLRVGGTGKTPMVEFLIRSFRPDHAVATLSRGYGRVTKGFQKVNSDSKVAEVGDEPYQIHQKYGQDIQVFVSENRVLGLEEILKEPKVPSLLILDDAFQHRAIRAQFYILLTTWYDPFFKDFLLPGGRLRESRQGAKRADAIVVTKCPSSRNLQHEDEMRRQIQSYSGYTTPVFFSSIDYGKPQPINHQEAFSPHVILFSGLADSSALRAYCEKNYQVLDVVDFPDHHAYSEKDYELLKQKASAHGSKNLVFLTTEKDGVKVKSQLKKGFLGEIPIFVLPIEAQFEQEEATALLQLIQQKVFGKDHKGE